MTTAGNEFNMDHLANETHTPFLAILSPIVVLCAIASSCLGHVMGAEEGTTYLVRAVAPGFAERLDPSILDPISVVGGVFITP